MPSDILLEIFDFFVVESDGFEAEDWWRTLVHVCRTWRIVIFGSPHRLNLRLACSDKTPVREMLDVWPPLPIVVRHIWHPNLDRDNIVAALERNDCIRQIGMDQDLQWEKALEAMREIFLALHLSLYSDIEMIPVVPDSFMSGSAPRLRCLRF